MPIRGNCIKVMRFEDTNGKSYMVVRLVYHDRAPEKEDSWNKIGRRYNEKGIRSRIKELKDRGFRIFYQDSGLEKEIKSILER